jgi:hypothetical protein
VTPDWPDTRFIFEVELNGNVLAQLISDPFTLPVPDPMPDPGSNQPAYRASNVDLISVGTIPGTGIVLNYSEKEFDLPDEDYERYLATSGRLNRGVYSLRATMVNTAWTDDALTEMRLHITNPSLIRLMFPLNGEQVTTDFPLFQFESDASNFMVHIYKRLNPEDDVETVLSGHPTLEFETPMKQFSYHVTDGDPLESGATYLWYVDALVYTTNGLESFKSNVWRFTVNTEGRITERYNAEELLRSLLGDRMARFLDMLADYDIRSILYNGEYISFDDLLEVLQNLQGTDFEVVGIGLE